MGKILTTLVTGGAGFIGSHLVDRLLADGHTVRVIDNFSRGRIENLAGTIDNPSLTVQRADAGQLEEIREQFEGVDWVFHLASLADIVPSIDDPIAYHEANVNSTVSVLEAAREAKVSRFIYAASSSCYGLADSFPTPESAPVKPMYPYALTKLVAEQYVLHWNNVYGLPALSLRLFNVYGPRSRTTGAYGAVFGVFLAQKLAGRPFTIVGDGTQTRDFTYVSDVVDAFVKAAESNCERDAFNVGSGGTYSVNQLVALLGGESIRIAERPGEPKCTYADTTRISKALGWSPRVKFEEGVGIMLNNIGQWQDAPVWDSNSIGEATQSWFEHLGTSTEDRATV